jgi:hypothetical protein
MKKIIFFFLLIFAGTVYAQSPTYLVRLKNGLQTGPNVYKFDVYIERTGTTEFQLATFQMGLLFNDSVKNGGTLTPTLGTSELNAAQTPTSVNAATTGCLKLAPKTPPGVGNGTIIPLFPGLKVTTITLTNSVPFANRRWNFKFNFKPTPYNSVVSAYVAGINTVITDSASHLNNLINDPMPIKLIETDLPNKYDLSQNYPNPFNPTTNISYDLPYDSKVMIKLFDMSGREVMTLVSGQMSAGYYTESFNLSNLSSGAYFYRISASGNGQDYTMTKKLMLVK